MKAYEYTECGLKDIILLNGFEKVKTPYGEGVKIHNTDELHKVIGWSIVKDPKLLTGEEIRFLRVEMELSQKNLAKWMDMDSQSIARWEKGEFDISGPADKLVRLLYLEHIKENSTLRKLCEEMAELDNSEEKVKKFKENDGWHTAA